MKLWSLFVYIHFYIYACNLIKINNISKWYIEYIQTCKYFVQNLCDIQIKTIITHYTQLKWAWLDSLKRACYEL